MPILQDPTAQTEIDNYMVQQLDGTVNEWGWCKQKVVLLLGHGVLMHILIFLFDAVAHCARYLLFSFVIFVVSLVQMLYWQYPLLFVKQVLV